MRHRLAVVLAGVVMLAACSDGSNEGRTTQTVAPESVVPDDTQATTPESTDPPETAPVTSDSTFVGDRTITWNDYGDGTSDGMLEVPMDYTRPDGATISLYVVRHSATDPANRIGTLLVNPGGPGSGGSGLAFAAGNIYGQQLLDRFDIIGWDPRGTGVSEPAVDCVDDYDRYFGLDSSPDTPQERQALIDAGTEFGEACAAALGETLGYVSTENSARDMDAIRQALGEDTISYFGFSYGSELGATWATLFPDTVRAVVIDGAVDPTVRYLQQNLQQAAGFESTFSTFLAACSSTQTCAFHNDGDAEGAYDRLADAIDATPVSVGDDRTEVTQGVLTTAVAVAMYDQGSWPRLEQALADLQAGDGDGVLALYDDYYGYRGGEWDDSYEAYFAIACLDDPGSTGPDDLYSHEAEFAAAAPRLGRSWMAELTFCSVWPVPTVGQVVITGKGAGPILVVGTTGDAATPLESTRNMARALEDGHLVIVDADQHTGYGVNGCVNDAVDNYLVDPTAPLEDELVC